MALTERDLIELREACGGRCAYTGLALSWADSHRQRALQAFTASLDRIDSTLPYQPGNIQWVHKAINGMKMAMTHDEFVYWCDAVSRHTRATHERGEKTVGGGDHAVRAGAGGCG